MSPHNTPRLETERLILRQFTADDAEALFAFLGDEETNHFLPWFTLRTLAEAEIFLRERFLAHYEKPFACRYAVCLKEDNLPIGYVWLADDESRDLGYCVKKEFWRKGIAGEAATAVIGQIRTAGLDYVTATHDVNNPRSGGVMRKLGMTYRYSFVEQVQPKNVSVVFRMYQLDLADRAVETYAGYWMRHQDHFVEGTF